MYAAIHIPDPEFRIPDLAAASAHAALLDIALSVSPRVEDTAPDTVTLDLAGLDRIFGAPAEIARHLECGAAELGLTVSVAVASNPDAAIHAARGFRGIIVIPPGQEAERLGSLPVSALTLAAPLLETLERWGVRTFQSLAALPTIELAERLGQEGVYLQKLARGRVRRTLVPCEIPLHFEEVLELDYPVTLLDPLAFILSRLLNQLCLRLKARTLATQEMRLRLEFETGVEEYETRSSKLEIRPDPPQPRLTDSGTRTPNPESRTLTLPVPTQDAQLLLKLWLFNLKSDPPAQPIVKVTLAAEHVKPRVAQGGLFLPPAPDPAKLEVTLARIGGVVGKERVGSPELVDTHRPGAFRMGRFSALWNLESAMFGVRGSGLGIRRNTGVRDSGLGVRRRQKPSPYSLFPTPYSLRIFRPPLHATVEIRDGRPARVFADGVSGDVVRAAGPWRTSGDWWRDDAWCEDEWDVELEPAAGDGSRTGLYRIYCDLPTGNWFVRGTYD